MAELKVTICQKHRECVALRTHHGTYHLSPGKAREMADRLNREALTSLEDQTPKPARPDPDEQTQLGVKDLIRAVCGSGPGGTGG